MNSKMRVISSVSDHEFAHALYITNPIKCDVDALEKANGRKVDGRRIVVDYERGRTK